MADTAASAGPGDAGRAYQVLARKYRPSTFDALIGQDAMVRTLGNALATGRVAHAFLLTGVRGVGKTSTARLIAKALNCIGPDGTGGPTMSPCGVCEHCRAIGESRHIDVIEMDAASRTGVDDVREIIEAVRYASVSARTKVYIIDEVHMLSKNAFNALLKTLEEPPPHVKFIFATTEIRKVPVTVLSRCQRFDLRRIPTEQLSRHFAGIVAQEQAQADPDALALIARAAEGSVRDGLSILDQAIAHGHGSITVEAVRAMIGLADRARVLDLMEALLTGQAAALLANLRDQYDSGADPLTVVQDLLELVHALTTTLAVGAPDPQAPEDERRRLSGWAAGLNASATHRLWQLLLKAVGEVKEAPVPIQAAEMALLRAMHAAGAPDPLELLRRLESGEGFAAPPGLPAPATPATAVVNRAPQHDPVPETVEALVALCDQHHEGLLAKHLHDDVTVVAYAPGRLELAPLKGAPADLAPRLSAALERWTGTPWQVSLVAAPADATSLRDQEVAATRAFEDEARATPIVQAAEKAFPGAEVIKIRRASPAPAARTGRATP